MPLKHSRSAQLPLPNPSSCNASLFFAQVGIVAKHNVVVFRGMKAVHCCIPLLELEVLFDIKWVIPLRNSIRSI